MAQSGKGGASSHVENHDKPGIRGLLRSFWARRWDQLGWVDRLMQQCRQTCAVCARAVVVGGFSGQGVSVGDNFLYDFKPLFRSTWWRVQRYFAGISDTFEYHDELLDSLNGFTR